MSVGGLAKTIGQSALDEWGAKLGTETLFRGVKAAALAAGHAEPDTSDDFGIGIIPFDAHPELKGQGFKSYLLAPKVYQDEPELFFGPFLQLGTYLKEKGVIDSEVVRWGLDLAIDPINLLSFGAGGAVGKALGKTGLTALGRAQRLIGVLAEGRVGIKGAEVIDRAREILEVAGKAAAAGPEIVAAAKAGDKAALKGVLEGALKAELPADYKAVTEALARDRKALGNVLQHTDNLVGHTLTPEDVLQDTLRGRIKQGAVKGIGVGVVIPDNPFKHPLAFSRQMLGFAHEGDNFWFPAADAVASGLDKVAPKAFEIRGAAALTEEASLKPIFEAQDAFRAPSKFRPRVTSWQAAVAHEALLAATSAPNQRIYAAVGYAEVDDKVLEKAYREVKGIGPKTEMEPALLAKFKEDVVQDMNGARSAVDKAVLGMQQDVINTMVGRIEDIAGQAVRANNLDAANVSALTSQARRIFDTLRRVETLRYEANGLGSALAGRANLGTLLAHVSNVNYREIIDGAYKGSGAREAMREVVGYAASHPEWFDKAGKLVATSEQIEKDGGHFFTDLLQRSKQIKSQSFLESHLRTEGLHPEVFAVANQMASALAGTGENLVAEGVLHGLIHDYFPRVLHFTDQGLKEFKLLHSDSARFLEGALTGKVTDDRIAAILDESGVKASMDKYRAGKLSFAEARTLPEKLARAFEKRGWATYERDNVAVYAAYMDSANKALLWNRIATNPEGLAPYATVEWIREAMGEKAARGLTNDYLMEMGVKHIMRADRVPAKVEHLFEKLTGQPRASEIVADTEALASAAATSVAARDLGKATEMVALSKLDGKSSLKLTVDGKDYTLKLLDKRTGKPVPFKASWQRTGKYPETLKNWKAVKEAVSRSLGEAVDAASVRVEGRVGKATEQVEVRTAAQVAVLKPHFGHLNDAFRLVRVGQINNQFTRFMDRWNYKLKSTLLMADVFHYNVLAFSSFAANPIAPLAMLKDEAGQFLPGAAEGGFLEKVGNSPALQKAALGALAGGGIAAAGDRDTGDIIAFSLAGAFYGATIAAAKAGAQNGYRKLISTDHLDTLLWMGLGGWSGRPDDRAIGIVQRGLKTLRNDLARDPRGMGALISPIDGVLHIADGWDRQLWDTLQNGIKHQFFATRWEREVGKLEASAGWGALSEEAKYGKKLDISKQLVQAANNMAGGQTWRFLLDRPQVQHTLRYILLSPDWTASRMQGASNIFLNLNLPQRAALGAALGTATDLVQYGADPDSPRWRGPILGALMGAGLGAWASNVAKRMGTRGDLLAKESRDLWTKALAMGYLSMEAMNFALSGHSMWENPEGKKTSIDMGDGTFVSLGKPWTEPLEFAGIYHADRYPIPVVSRLKSKAAVLPLAAVNLLSNSDGFGPLITSKDSLGEVSYKLADFAIDLATPIIAQGPARLAAEAVTGQTDRGSTERALLRLGGFSTTTIPNYPGRQAAGIGLPSAALRPPGLGAPPLLFGGNL